ncbi:phage integrase N-terminal SAM-like domain-containing protein [Mesorhizobium australicum]|uniref:phage integrase N-terminal SAM-like domain-containing protein n=1 Tax=Mesorhizobium australicum TaxID=536018 RepID=UPI001FCD92EB|nr:phage integrase N-terminal SAM-like domain-containing protein [Mesorhizobium australicum]
MTHPALDTPISPLRQRLIDDMNMRRFSRETQRNYLRDVGRFATFVGRPPDTATSDDLRRFQIEQQEDGVPVPTMNSIVSALRFFLRIRSIVPIWRTSSFVWRIRAGCRWC